MTILWLALLGLSGSIEEQTLPGLGKPVRVCFDAHLIPHIYADNWPDAARALGYLHAVDRLAQMEMFRRTATGRMAEVAGPGHLEMDQMMRRLDVKGSCEAFWNLPDLPSEFRAELLAYAEGVNARIAELEVKGFPAVLKMMGVQPAKWSPVDSIAWSKYMGWDQAGTMDDLWFGIVQEKFGQEAFEQLWSIDRPYELPTVVTQARRDSLVTRPFRSVPIPGAAAAYEAALAHLPRSGWLTRGLAFGSNNWAVSGAKSASGKPIFCSDPHLSLTLPSIWYACHLSVRGENVAGVTFPGGPTVVIGHTDHHAWGMTNLQADAVDYFVETVKADDPLSYQHKGEWKKMTRRTEEIRVKGQAPVQMQIDSTVHGPVVERQGRTISLQWTGLGVTRDPLTLWLGRQAKSLKEFLAAADELDVPGLNLLYADVEGNIALYCAGRLPVRKKGQGRLPMDGASGDNDWAGWIPRPELPLGVNPPAGYIASANNLPAAGNNPYLGWMWDVSWRKRRIDAVLAKSDHLTVERLGELQNDAYDLGAERFLDVLKKLLAAKPPEDATGRQAAEAVATWDFIAEPQATAAIIWARWFERFRSLVWDDEFESRGVPPHGSWGFSGTNRREPELEVLEYLTREKPDSVWFDDRRTPQKETRDELMRRAFDEVIAGLKKERGDNLENWKWRYFNVLKLNSLYGIAPFGREIGPARGTGFTVCPGSNGGAVTASASWRLIVDMANPVQSVGVYPGGQPDNPISPLYADMARLWTQGKYVPLHPLGNPDQLPREARLKVLMFRPGK